MFYQCPHTHTHTHTELKIFKSNKEKKKKKKKKKKNLLNTIKISTSKAERNYSQITEAF